MVPHMAKPEVGDALFFYQSAADGESRQIVTSRVERIGRPEKGDVMLYPEALR